MVCLAGHPKSLNNPKTLLQREEGPDSNPTEVSGNVSTRDFTTAIDYTCKVLRYYGDRWEGKTLRQTKVKLTQKSVRKLWRSSKGAAKVHPIVFS